MPNFKEVTEAYAGAVGRFNSATKNLSAFLRLFREGVELELGAPKMIVKLFPINGEADKDHSGSPTVAQFDGQNSWRVGLAITLAASTQSLVFHIILDVRNGEWFARIEPDGEPYEAKKDIKAFANKLAELAIDRLSKLSINPAKDPNWIFIKQGQ